MLTAPAVLALLVFFLAPFAIFVVYSLSTGGPSTFAVRSPMTFDNYADALGSATNRTLAVNSALTGLFTALATVCLALPIAYWLRYRAGRLQLPFILLVVTAMFASYLVRIYSWRSILGEHGFLNEVLIRLGIVDHPLGFLLFSRFAVVIALVHIFLPYVILMLYAAFTPIEPRYLETARDLGASFWTAARKVIAPMVAAPVVSAFMFVFILSASDYVTPQFLGGVHGTLIGVQIQNQFKVLGDYAAGAALSMILLLCFALIYFVIQGILRRKRLTNLEWGS